MKYTIEGFSQRVLVDLGLDAVDALILRWFCDFKDSGRMSKDVKPEDGKIYFWVNYQFLIDDLPILGIRNKEALAKRFKKICASGVLLHWPKKHGGTFSMYSLVESVYSTLGYDRPTQKSDPSDSKVDTPSDSKVGTKDPSTKINKSTNTHVVFVAPTPEQVTEYGKESGFKLDGQFICRYYDPDNTGTWIDSTGKKVKNWKQKVLSVWCKDNNKIQPIKQPIMKYDTPEEIAAREAEHIKRIRGER